MFYYVTAYLGSNLLAQQKEHSNMKQGQVEVWILKLHFKKWIKNTFKTELTYRLEEKPNLINECMWL